MQTHFTDADRQKPHIQEAERILRTCVHCGFCNATCPTYQLLGDERDGPRGRIYLMKELLESRDALEEVTESCDVSMRDTLNRVRGYRLHKKRTNSETEVDYGIVAELINQLELLVRDW